MNDTDIVVGYGGKVQVLYSNATSGYPAGTPSLQITNPSSMYADGTVTVCFQRSLSNPTGHVDLSTAGLIWAVGDASAGLSYHGADGHDDSGMTQTHRSDEVKPIDWKTGACRHPVPPKVIEL